MYEQAAEEPLFSVVEEYFKKLKYDFLHRIEERNARFFDEEIEKLDTWTDDLKKSIELEIKQLDVEIKTRKT